MQDNQFLEDEVGKLRTMAEIITRTTDEKKGLYELKIEEYISLIKDWST